jgi:integrase
LARWREPGGKKRAQSFETAEDREQFAESWVKRKTTWGKAAPVVHPREVEIWRTFRELTGGADPLAVARFWLEFRPKVGGAMLLKTAIESLQTIRKASDPDRDDSHLNLHLRRLQEAFPKRTLGDLTTEALRTWLSQVKSRSGAPIGPYARRHHLETLRILFRTAVRERWLGIDPTEAIEPPVVVLDAVSVLSVEDARKLFDANRDQPCIGRLALEAFAGLRYTSAARIAKEDIHFKERGITLPALKHKSRRRHYIEGLPDNLWSWLEIAPDACWTMTRRQYLEAKSKAFARAGVPHPHNVLRHSFASYHVALHQNAAKTAVLLTHRSPAMLYQHYKGRATARDASRFFSLLAKDADG